MLKLAVAFLPALGASAICLRAAQNAVRRRDGVTGPRKRMSRAGLLIGAVVMWPAFVFVAFIVWPTPVETLTMRATGTGSYLTNEDGDKIDGNRYTMTLHVGERARCHVRRLPLMGPVIESCSRLTPRAPD